MILVLVRAEIASLEGIQARVYLGSRFAVLFSDEM